MTGGRSKWVMRMQDIYVLWRVLERKGGEVGRRQGEERCLRPDCLPAHDNRKKYVRLHIFLTKKGGGGGAFHWYVLTIS